MKSQFRNLANYMWNYRYLQLWKWGFVSFSFTCSPSQSIFFLFKDSTCYLSLSFYNVFIWHKQNRILQYSKNNYQHCETMNQSKSNVSGWCQLLTVQLTEIPALSWKDTLLLFLLFYYCLPRNHQTNEKIYSIIAMCWNVFFRRLDRGLHFTPPRHAWSFLCSMYQWEKTFSTVLLVSLSLVLNCVWFVDADVLIVYLSDYAVLTLCFCWNWF